MTVIYLVKNYSVSWRLMPDALDRIEKFCQKYETDGDERWSRETLIKAFASDAPNLMCFLLLECDKVVGHVLCGLDEWAGKRFLTILQYEMDGPGDPNVILKALRDLEQWGRAIGANGWQAICRDATLARVFRTYYGFEESGFLVRRAFSPPTDSRGVNAPIEEPTIARMQGVTT